ncbi:GNAT family N-acetyltransferase [Bacillus sp. FJAT-49736]|uniref:GNAT family N-acetyltransferase n=1 Tax=Bacillus sp. FJAT-49736 TaxID=2833582 RepID=UPI001BC9A9E1|nr:GNAT family N-acetyltransferase [Bacillus sp. FJAT-49736]MBS4172170.1 GNAT family N-acetyltransferase [Bacillus sp. FJAT-49736]
MKSMLRKLTKEDMPLYVDIVINAYPGVMENTLEAKNGLINKLTEIQEKDDSINFYGLFRDNTLLGGMRIHYYRMNFYSSFIEVGGLGLVAVDLLHKKEKVAKELVEFYIQHIKQRGSSLALLYPFRPQFYKKMGFGYGTKMNEYIIKPHSFPAGTDKKGLFFADLSHKRLIKDCYERKVRSQHGMISKTESELDLMFRNPNHRLIGFMHNKKVEGYLLFTVKRDPSNFLKNDLVVKELVYENPLALSKLSSFINSQADQFNNVILQTQDNYLEYFVCDPTNGTGNLIPSVYHETNKSGTGLMYRIIDIENVIKHYFMNNTQKLSITVKINIVDTFLMEQNRSIILTLNEGELVTCVDNERIDVEIELDISDFSSLLVGACQFKKLYEFGKLKISNIEYMDTLESLFFQQGAPICITAF